MFVGNFAASFISPRRCVCVRWPDAGADDGCGGIDGGGCVGGPVRTDGGVTGMPGGCVRCDCVVTGGGAGTRCACVVTGRACVLGAGARSPKYGAGGTGACGAADGQFV